jgi:predicted secreted hydrolase
MLRLTLIILISLVLLGSMLVIIYQQEPAEEIRARLALAEAFSEEATEGFAQVEQPWSFQFPQDHGAHPQFECEWWYFTGNLEEASSRHFGYQFTIFRIAATPKSPARQSLWAASNVYMGHFTVTDVNDNRFYAFERFGRDGRLGLAGANTSPLKVWLEDWGVEQIGSEVSYGMPLSIIRAKENNVAVELTLRALKPVVLHGDKGMSRKGKEKGNASYYYSYTRLQTEGTISIGDHRYSVAGFSWMDREWFTNLLRHDQVGWNWYSLQLDDMSEIMFYRIRYKGGGQPDMMSGTFVPADGRSEHLGQDEVIIEILDHWKSPLGADYPSRWKMKIPRKNLEIFITPRIDNQELPLSVRYWEGAVEVKGKRDGKSLTGSGYVELTGYYND